MLFLLTLPSRHKPDGHPLKRLKADSVLTIVSRTSISAPSENRSNTITCPRSGTRRFSRLLWQRTTLGDTKGQGQPSAAKPTSAGPEIGHGHLTHLHSQHRVARVLWTGGRWLSPWAVLDLYPVDHMSMSIGVSSEERRSRVIKNNRLPLE